MPLMTWWLVITCPSLETITPEPRPVAFCSTTRLRGPKIKSNASSTIGTCCSTRFSVVILTTAGTTDSTSFVYSSSIAEERAVHRLQTLARPLAE
jgi:hypothetical protein